MDITLTLNIDAAAVAIVAVGLVTGALTFAVTLVGQTALLGVIHIVSRRNQSTRGKK